MKFKVGDRVRYKHRSVEQTWIPESAIGTVIKNDRAGVFTYQLLFDNGKKDGFQEKHLEHARIRNNPITRTLYPHYKVIDEDWLEVTDETES